MDFHGAPMNRTWVKLGATAKKGDAALTCAEAVQGWRPGDRVIITSTHAGDEVRGTRRGHGFTEERFIRSIDGTTIALDRPLDFEHMGTGDYRGEVANLSRNVVVESADPARSRGHTMYHRGRPGPSAMRSSAISARRACWAATACITTCAATPCAAVPWSARRSGTAAIAG